MNAALWVELTAPFSPLAVAAQFVFAILGAGAALHWVPRAKSSALVTLGLYTVAATVLLCINALEGQGWLAASGKLAYAMALIMGLALIRLGGIVLFRVLLPLVKLRPSGILEDLAVIAGYIGWGLFGLSHVGVDLASIVTTSAVITAILAFSLQDTLGNILGGTTLQLENSIQVDDWIKVGDTIGRIVDIRWRSTVIETRNWETVVIPNAQLMKNTFAILGRRRGEPQQWRRWIWFNVDFGVSPQRVISTVEHALRHARIPNVATRPAPSCVTMALDGSIIKYGLRYWLTDLAVDDPTDSAVRLRIYNAFQRAGIRFAIPEQTMHMVKENAKREDMLAQQQLQHRIATLRQIELFSALDEGEREMLARHLVYAPFAAGETVTRQGQTANWLYLLTSGEVAVELCDDAGRCHQLNRLDGEGGGAYFGEMGLLTGEPRAATVTAVTDVECYRLEKQALEQILRMRPEIADAISTVMTRRNAALREAQDSLAQRAPQSDEQQRLELLGRIRRFFNLDA